MRSTNKKTLLVLAASYYQIDTIQRAKALGYRVVTSDNVPDNPGHRLADVSYNVSTTERTDILILARREKINGVIAPATEVAMPTLAFIARKLGLIGPPPESVETVCVKIRFREFLKENGYPFPPYLPISKDFVPDESLFDGKRLILKPSFSSGSKGIFIVDNVQDLNRFFPETLQFSLDGRAVLETYIEGFQGTCEGVLQDGEIVWAIFMDKQIAPPPYTATWGHIVPTILPGSAQKQVLETLTGMWNQLNIQDGPFDCDFVVENDRVFILEITPRLGGNSIPRLIEKSAGFSITDMSIRYSCEGAFALPDPWELRPMALLLLGLMQEGRLEYNRREAENLRKSNWVISLILDRKPGESVKPFIHGRRRIGEAILLGDSREDLEARITQFKTRLDLRVKS